MQIIEALDFTDIGTFITSFVLLFLIVFLRYIFISGAYHWVFLVMYRNRFRQRILSEQNPNARQIKRELLLSAYSAIIFSLMGMLLLILRQKGYTQIYSDINEYPLWYIPVSILLYLVLHDAYYYWLHRWMHKSKLIRHFHMEHHKSVDTTVFTSFSFHPVESFLQALIIPLLLLIIPMCVIALMVTLTLMTISAIINHAGVEIYPSKKNSSFFRKYIIGATHHDYHHRNSKKHFGLYFTFWDRVMKTEL